MKQKKRNAHGGAELLPGILCLAFLPFIVRLYVLDNTLVTYPWFSGAATWGDLFLYGKMKCFYIICGFMLLMLADAFLVKRECFPADKAFWLLAGYELLAVLSTLCSKNCTISVKGCLEQFEPVFVLLGYGICCFYGYYLARTKKKINTLLAVAISTAFLLSVIGMFQFAGSDLLQTDFAKRIYVPQALREYRDDLSFNFSSYQWNNVYMTLYNPNYVGSYVCLIFPVVVCGLVKYRKKWAKFFCAATMILLFVCLLGSGSKTGLISLVVALLFSGFLWGMRRVAHKKRLLVSEIVLLIVGSAGVLLWTGAGDGTTSKSVGANGLSDIELYEDAVYINYNDYPLYIGYEITDRGIVPVFRDENGDAPMCEYAVDGEYYVIVNEKMQGVSIGCFLENDAVHLGVAYEDEQWIFRKQQGGKFRYVTKYNKEDDVTQAKTILPASMDTLFTYRGYIWSRTIPLLKDWLLIGSGPDTFALVFPQNDYVERIRQGKGFFDEILTRPHSMYLQWALQTGVASLICMMTFLLLVLARAVRLLAGGVDKKCVSCSCKEQDERELFIDVAALSAGVFAYLLAGICNDSCIAVAPGFWLLLGVLYGKVSV